MKHNTTQHNATQNLMRRLVEWKQREGHDRQTAERLIRQGFTAMPPIVEQQLQEALYEYYPDNSRHSH